ncbi:MAG: oligosaccharide flippase family protein [Cognatishimia sp.]
MRTVELLKSSFLTNLLAYGASEVVCKFSRLFVVIVVARTLGVAEIGVAAAALAICEIFKGLTENGIGQRIIKASDTQVEAICTQAHRLFWISCLGLFALQLALAALLASFGFVEVALLVALAALEYLFMPAGLVQAALAVREGKLKQTAAIAGLQVLTANILSVVLVIIMPSAMVLILPRVLTAPLWLLCMRRLRPWQKSPHVMPAPTRPFLRYGVPVLGVELVKMLRLHADKLIVGSLLGAESLGLYFIAFNAGLSLVTSYIAAFEKVVFPQLCTRQNGRFGPTTIAFSGLALIAPFVIAQSAFASAYVPLLLGPGWEDIVPVVQILCLTALPLTIWSVAAAQLRVTGRPEIEFTVTLTVTIGLAMSAWICAPYGVLAMAIGYVCTLSIVFLLASVPVLVSPASFTSFFRKQEI